MNYVMIALALIVILFAACAIRRASSNGLAFVILVDAMVDMCHILFFWVYIVLDE